MKKKRVFKPKISLIGAFFHKPLLVIFLIGLLPFVLWGSQQSQFIISIGKNNQEIKTNLLPQQQSSCPATSNQTYTSRSLNPNKPNRMNFDPSNNPETNINLRGWYEVNEGKNLISRNGDNYGLDPNMPPQISTLFTSHYPKIIKTYRMNAWDYDNNHNKPGESATPNYAVHVLGLEAIPGEPLVGLKAGSFLVRFATKNYILMTNGDDDAWDADDDGGYPFYYLDICVDPNLLAAYEADNAGGRNRLPTISEGQIFGYAMSNEVKFVIRDTFSFMDTRYKEDWWEYGGFQPSFGPPAAVDTNIPTQIPTVLPIPSAIVIPTYRELPINTPIPSQSIPTQIPVLPTQNQIQVTLKPIFITPTPRPKDDQPLAETITPTPKPLVDVKKTIENAKSAWTRIFDAFIRFTRVILP